MPDKSGRLRFLEVNVARQTFAAAKRPDTSDWQNLRARPQDMADGEHPHRTIVDPGSVLIEAPALALLCSKRSESKGAGWEALQ